MLHSTCAWLRAYQAHFEDSQVPLTVHIRPARTRCCFHRLTLTAYLGSSRPYPLINPAFTVESPPGLVPPSLLSVVSRTASSFVSLPDVRLSAVGMHACACACQCAQRCSTPVGHGCMHTATKTVGTQVGTLHHSASLSTRPSTPVPPAPSPPQHLFPDITPSRLEHLARISHELDAAIATSRALLEKMIAEANTAQHAPTPPPLPASTPPLSFTTSSKHVQTVEDKV